MAHLHMPAFIDHIDAVWLAAFHSYTSPAFDWIAYGLSTISWMGACWFILAGVLWLRGYRLLAMQVILAMIIGGIFAEGFKFALHRVRPSELMPQYVHLPLPALPDTRWSFPSGHAVLAAAAAFAVLFASHRTRAWWLVLGAISICWSRIYQGVHWTSDVFAGFIIGIVCAVISVLASVAFENNPLINKVETTRRARAVSKSTIAG